MISFNPLWKTLTSKNMTKTQMRELVGFSTATLAKLSKDEYVSLQVIDNICEALQVKSITEVVDYVNKDFTTLEDIEHVINILENNKNSDSEDKTRNIFMLYLLIEEFIEKEMDSETKENNDKFMDLYTDLFQKKLLPKDLLDGINDLLKKQLF